MTSSTGPVTAALDTALDKSLVLGYSRIGMALRRRWWPADPEPGSLAGRHVVVTGGSGGLGRATATGLAALGATVHLVGRSGPRLAESAEAIRREVPAADLVEDVCDVSDLDAVRSYAADLTGRLDGLHALVHNAGVMPPERTVSAQGHESTLATHVLGPVLMTELLRPLLVAEESPRVVVVSSGGMYSAPLDTSISDDLEFRRGTYEGIRAYARTKRLQVTMAEELAARYDADGIAVHSMHPGWADTPGVSESMPRFARVAGPILRTAEQGADTIVWLAASERATDTTGQFWCDRRARPTYYLPWQSDDPQARRSAWSQVLDLTTD
ncbi:oxidoreductase, short chain dehydrogenase/reductase family protein [Aeromicrobium marinum DSM 15272]|uniref:Oxidoreductase, short chain dehydrogenase/reductase family protein n=1 Tax=Aeromicrobium marinum DSM 15272 TaxID=585531 RepID=E2SD67_9ACTN|nr:SDR family NAD(P)-dependent oxidoreductase [Aeromicrobium marinum]EFQ83170.1 oxidoreductase, short chain dehydrogenase/reductase family protein [Aeromicrobium marinum DSM 15272]